MTDGRTDGRTDTQTDGQTFLRANVVMTSSELQGIVVMGDFNFDCNMLDKSFCLIKNFTDEYKLLCCESAVTSKIAYTYFQETLNNYSTIDHIFVSDVLHPCLLYTSPSPRDRTRSRMPSSA